MTQYEEQHDLTAPADAVTTIAADTTVTSGGIYVVDTDTSPNIVIDLGLPTSIGQEVKVVSGNVTVPITLSGGATVDGGGAPSDLAVYSGYTFISTSATNWTLI
jgi:hypothetical protein